jgi:hypothetical protein
MLPTEDAAWVGEELSRRFGLPYWQFALTATDAKRFAIRLAREITGRPKVLVFNWCYHGTVDETFVALHDGQVVARRGNLGPPVPLDVTTRVVEFNDLEALERELANGNVACVLTETALTNVGIVHPDPGFHDALRELTRSAETLPSTRRTPSAAAPAASPPPTGSSPTCSRSASPSREACPRPPTGSARRSHTAWSTTSSSRTSTSVG